MTEVKILKAAILRKGFHKGYKVLQEFHLAEFQIQSLESFLSASEHWYHCSSDNFTVDTTFVYSENFQVFPTLTSSICNESEKINEVFFIFKQTLRDEDTVQFRVILQEWIYKVLSKVLVLLKSPIMQFQNLQPFHHPKNRS